MLIAFKELDSSLNLAGTQATRADMNRLGRTVNNGLNLSYVRFPGSAALSVRVRNVMAEANCLIAIFTFCHCDTPVQSSYPKSIYYFLLFVKTFL